MACTFDYQIPEYAKQTASERYIHEPSPAHGDAQYNGIDHKFPTELQGFVLIFPERDRVYWSAQAAALHGELANQPIEFSLRQFMQWYLPSQRDLFAQSIFDEANNDGFQLDLCIAHSNQHVRYLCIPLQHHNSVIWAGFVRSTLAQKNKVLIDLALRKARQVLAELC